MTKSFDVSDVALGAFASVPPSEKLDHLVRLLSTWGGSDKFFMLVQAILKILDPFLRFRAGAQLRMGLSKSAASPAAESCRKFAGIIGDSRTSWRIWGLLPIFQWLISLERTPQPTRRHLQIERLQGWSMLGYYPFEHACYLLSHGIISSPRFKSKSLSMWSCRFWLAYVALQLFHLREDRTLLLAREHALRKAKGTGSLEKGRADLRRKWDAFWNELVENAANLPIAIDASLEQGLFKNELWTTVFGLIAAIAAFRGAWKATALPSPVSVTDDETTEEKTTTET
ncbi:hypothetical protein FISHEDRAFT_36456 [Fistulina hepatica ATCC 64428]|uniref:Peroxisomal biogenesis factor 11 n=1 Tax=Fistulina hepatica ATCC 64428 TaxID=1128425 RepID=A0A0D7AJG9_9AGAR|nr:hypothetical protein FISHEDRAFT_36456 [Fistulina hepatica ATCC 64428]